MENLRKNIKARVGVYTIGLGAYWPQFDGLEQRMKDYNAFLAKKMQCEEAEIFNYGLVDNEKSAHACGEWFQSKNVDIVFCHCGTYANSADVMPVHQICKAPAVVLNLQPSMRVNYDKTSTGEWLAHCGACVAIELANAFERYKVKFHVVNGLLGMEETPAISITDERTCDRPEAKRAWNEIYQWIKAARVKRVLANSRFGFLGNNYSGMLDMYSDFTLIQRTTGIHVQILEMCDLSSCIDKVTDEDIARKRTEIEDLFEISGDSPADPLAKKPTQEQLNWSSKIAAAQEKMIHEHDIDGLAYYYHGRDNNYYEQVQSGFIVGHSMLTAQGVPCAGEGDMKTCLAMKICDTLGIGGSFCEIITSDYIDGTILLGHDGPFHIAISNGKPILRGMGVYHGKRGTGISVEAKVKTGDITTLGVTQLSNGTIKFIISEGYSTGGKIMAIGNTQTPVKFGVDPDTYMTKWFNASPIHHFAMSVGKNASLLKKVADMLGVETEII